MDYDQLADDYASHRRVHPAVLARLLGALGPAARVVEVGCGTANYLARIEEAIGCSCVGVEPSSEMLARAHARPTRARFSQGRAERLELEDAGFDLVFSVDVIHHVGDRAAAFSEAFRILRAGGRVCTVTDSEWVIRHREPLATYFPETVAIDIARYPTMDELDSAMKRAGFVAREEETVEHAYKLADASAYRAKVFSSLLLLDEATFGRGLERLEADLARGPIPCVSRYSMIWATKPR